MSELLNNTNTTDDTTMHIKASGPLGALLAIANVDVELHGVRVKRFPSGRISATDVGHGETSLTVFYLDGKRSTRALAFQRLCKHIAKDQDVKIDVPWFRVK